MDYYNYNYIIIILNRLLCEVLQCDGAITQGIFDCVYEGEIFR